MQQYTIFWASKSKEIWQYQHRKIAVFRLSIKAPERTQDTLRKVGSIDRPYKIQASARLYAVPMLVCLPFFRARSTLVRLSPEENGIGHPFSPVCQLAENTFSTSCSRSGKPPRLSLFPKEGLHEGKIFVAVSSKNTRHDQIAKHTAAARGCVKKMCSLKRDSKTLCCSLTRLCRFLKKKSRLFAAQKKLYVLK